MDQTVDPPSSLETVATDDVNLDESEEDDSFTRGRLGGLGIGLENLTSRGWRQRIGCGTTVCGCRA